MQSPMLRTPETTSPGLAVGIKTCQATVGERPGRGVEHVSTSGRFCVVDQCSRSVFCLKDRVYDVSASRHTAYNGVSSGRIHGFFSKVGAQDNRPPVGWLQG